MLFVQCDNMVQDFPAATSELRVPIHNHVAVRASFGQGLAQLLDHPLRSRMSGHIAVKDLSAFVGNYEEAVEQPEGHRRHRGEVHGNDDFAVVLEERKPLSARVPPATNPRKIPGYTAFRHDEAELLQLAMDFG